jgi:heme exporter protein A
MTIQTQNDDALVINDLKLIRHNQILFEHLNITLHPGQILVVEGLNGSGKSSLLRILTGLSRPDAGAILWQGHSINQLGSLYTQYFHYVTHHNGLKLDLSVYENIQMQCAISYLPKQKTIDQVLTLLQLTKEKNRLARFLSAGQKRRLALAKLWLIDKPLWILDEPLTALDQATISLFISYLNQHLQQNGRCILSTHHHLTIKNKQLLRLKLWQN